MTSTPPATNRRKAGKGMGTSLAVQKMTTLQPMPAWTPIEMRSKRPGKAIVAAIPRAATHHTPISTQSAVVPAFASTTKGATGLRLDHVDVHKHYHLHPVVGREVIAAAQRFGALAVRIPVEPVSVIRRVEAGKVAAPLAFACCARLLRPRARRARLLTPDAMFGLAWSGEFTADRLLALLRHLPPGVVEIYTHPATVDQFCGSACGYRYSEELEALCASEVLAQLRRSRLEPIGYSDLAE